jgi:hypothetical protein
MRFIPLKILQLRLEEDVASAEDDAKSSSVLIRKMISASIDEEPLEFYRTLA